MASQLNIGEEAFEEDSPLSDRPMSNLEKVQFIVGYAILRPGLRSVPTPIIPPENTAPHQLSALGPSLTCSPPWSLQAGSQNSRWYNHQGFSNALH